MADKYLNGPFEGDMKPCPSPTSMSQKLSLPSYLPTKEDTSVLKTVTEVSLPHSNAKLESPFEQDFRPGVDSSKK
jgi:hypothetical protein